MLQRAPLLVLIFALVAVASFTQASASCTVNQTCSGAPPISCTGNTSYNAGAGGTGWVQCDDGPQIDCPDCSQDGLCNPACYPESDLDCCGSDGYCNSVCKRDSDCCIDGGYCLNDAQCGYQGICRNKSCICI